MKANVPKNSTTNLILQYYKEYQDIYNISLPHIFIKYFNSVIDKINDAAYIKIEGSNFILMVDKLANTIFKDSFKSLMFHEFTHIFDIHINKNIMVEDITSYSEIHASYIQLQCTFNTIEQNITKVSLTDMMNDGDKKVSLENFLTSKLIDICKFIHEFYNTGEYSFYTRAYKHTLYYFGYIRFCESFCIDNIIDFYNLDTFEKHFGHEIIDIFNEVQHPFYLSENTANLIKNKQNIILINMLKKQQLIKDKEPK